jgi:hypothetical protein
MPGSDRTDSNRSKRSSQCFERLTGASQGFKRPSIDDRRPTIRTVPYVCALTAPPGSKAGCQFAAHRRQCGMLSTSISKVKETAQRAPFGQTIGFSSFNHQWLLNITDSPKFASNPGISTRDRAANRSSAAVPFSATIALDSPIPAPQHSYPMPHANRDASSHHRLRCEPQALFF